MKKVKIGISLDQELYDWLVSRTGSGREFASISHAVERSVATYQARQPPEAPRAPHPPHGPGDDRSSPTHGRP